MLTCADVCWVWTKEGLIDKEERIQENANPSQLTYADKMMYADVCSA
jgi:hypothetical protein